MHWVKSQQALFDRVTTCCPKLVFPLPRYNISNTYVVTQMNCCSPCIRAENSTASAGTRIEIVWATKFSCCLYDVAYICCRPSLDVAEGCQNYFFSFRARIKCICGKKKEGSCAKEREFELNFVVDIFWLCSCPLTVYWKSR